MARHRVLISEEATRERRQLNPAQEKKLRWWGDRLAVDPTAGGHVRRNLIPRDLKRRFGIENLWRVELPDGWRMLYTIVAKPAVRPEVRILRILSHKAYDRLFGYATS